MPIKKSQLYSSLWASCDELRGGMDASQYKDYVLFMLFIKYISDKYADSDDFAPPVTIPPGASFKDMLGMRGKVNIGERINTEVIQPLIDNNSRLARSDFPDFNDPNKLGEGQAMVDRLTNLINIFREPALDFSKNRADHDDILGDAYEYLMRHFAQESGKSKGQFYTPAEVSRVIAKAIGITPQNTVASTTAYDPTCGSGSLLLKVASEARKHITLEGQEKDVTTAGLARMNMILHDFPTANILNGNTLAAPKFKDGERLRTYDYVVANPPFSDKTWSTGITPSTDKYQRFEWGEPPAKQGDYAYLLHIIRSMKSSGKGACILPHGVLFRGNAEAVIREKLVRSGILKGIIGLPANLFYGTGIPACILVLDKENANARKGIFMIDASKGFIKDGNKNRLREQDVHKIVDTFKKQLDVLRYSRMVPFDEIADPKNAYNLNLPRYIDSTEPEDVQDIDGHIRGGIPQGDIDDLGAYWSILPALQDELFESAGRQGYSRLRVPEGAVKTAILGHCEFEAFKASVAALFDGWKRSVLPLLKGFSKDSQPKELIGNISEALLEVFTAAPLLDHYDVYQHLMDFWSETMQDDCYLIAADGWKAEARRILEEVKAGKNKGKMKDKGWTCDLIPKTYIVARYFTVEEARIDELQGQFDEVSATMDELQEEHGGEEGILKDVSSKNDAVEAYTSALIAVWNEDDKASCGRYSALKEDADAQADSLRVISDNHFLSFLKKNKGKLTQKAVKERLASAEDREEIRILQGYLDVERKQKEAVNAAKTMLEKIENGYRKLLDTEPLPENMTDLQVTVRFLDLLDRQTALRTRIRAMDDELDFMAYSKYPELSEDEIQTLVVDDKWLAVLTTAVFGEIDRVSQKLADRIRELAERYATPLPKLEADVNVLSLKVAEHLKNMGAVWN